RHYHDGREIAGRYARHVILLVKERGEEAREADEATEREAVEQREPERVRLTQYLHVVFPSKPRRLRRTILCEQRKDNRDARNGNQRKTEGGCPPEAFCKTRRKQRRHQRSRIARADDAHGEALIFGGVPTARERKRHGETRAGDAEKEPENEEVPRRTGYCPA